MDKVKVLVLGGSGFVGETLMQHLIQASDAYSITALQHHNAIKHINHKVTIVHGGLSALTNNKLQEINPDIVFHLARNNSGKGKWGRYLAATKGYYANKKLLNNLNQLNKPVTIVYLSGSLMYGEGVHNENSPLKPTSFAKQYVIAESPFLTPQKYRNLSITLVRVPWILGFGSWFKSFYHQPVQATKSITCYSHNKFKMHFISVEDCAANLIHLSKLNFKGVFNLFMPNAITYYEFIDEIAMAYEINQIKSHDTNLVKQKFETAIVESFSKEITLTSLYPEIQYKMIFTDESTKDMIKRKLRSFAHHK